MDKVSSEYLNDIIELRRVLLTLALRLAFFSHPLNTKESFEKRLRLVMPSMIIWMNGLKLADLPASINGMSQSLWI